MIVLQKRADAGKFVVLPKKNIVIVTAAKVQMQLGVHVTTGKRGLRTRRVVLFTRDQRRYEEVDAAFRRGGYHALSDDNFFGWEHFGRKYLLTRGEVKKRLQSMGFDATAVDEALARRCITPLRAKRAICVKRYDPFTEEHEKQVVVPLGTADLFLGTGFRNGIKRLVLFTKTPNHYVPIDTLYFHDARKPGTKRKMPLIDMLFFDNWRDLGPFRWQWHQIRVREPRTACSREQAAKRFLRMGFAPRVLSRVLPRQS